MLELCSLAVTLMRINGRPQVVGCSACAVTDYGEDSEGQSVLKSYLKKE